MKSYLSLLIVIALMQGARGGMLEDMIAKGEEELAGILSPLLQRVEGLQELVAQAKQTKEKSTMLGIDLDACANLTLSLEEGEKLVFNVSKEAYGLAANLTMALNNILNCGSINPVHFATCLIDNFHIIKEDVNKAKPMIARMKEEIDDMYIEIHAQFLECIGWEKVFGRT